MILTHALKLNGDFYSTLLPLAEMMEAVNRNPAACLIYRSLLTSILTRGYIKSYPHGSLSLKKLDKLGAAVSDWKGFHHHEDFKSRLFREHGRKYSFWSKYKAKK